MTAVIYTDYKDNDENREGYGASRFLFIFSKFGYSNVTQSLTSCLGSVEEVNEALIGGTLHLLDLCAVLIDLESGHALDASFLGAFSIGVDVELHHGELWVVGDMTLIDGSNSLARWAPCGCEVDDQRLATTRGSSDSSQEGGLVSDVHICVICHVFL